MKSYLLRNRFLIHVHTHQNEGTGGLQYSSINDIIIFQVQVFGSLTGRDVVTIKCKLHFGDRDVKCCCKSSHCLLEGITLQWKQYC